MNFCSMRALSSDRGLMGFSSGKTLESGKMKSGTTVFIWLRHQAAYLCRGSWLMVYTYIICLLSTQNET